MTLLSFFGVVKLVKKIKSYHRRSKLKGFTLIELLVVIGILAIMIAALVATIDPFEQLKKAQDSNLKNMVTEFIAANQRYYGTHNALPWFDTASGGANCYSSGTTLSAVSLGNLKPCLQTLVTEGEIKQGFLNASGLSSVIVTNPNPQSGSATDVIVCFQPQSKSQQKDPVTIYNEDGSNGNNCKAQGGTVSCYWCQSAQ